MASPSNMQSATGSPSLSKAIRPITPGRDNTYPESSIAITGIACRFPGADSVEQFWDLISAGTSMLKEFPSSRFSSKGLRRTQDENFRFLGNFLEEPDAFDHKFFKKSPREAASMDPQQRLILQVAYEALESAGYFGRFGDTPDRHVGCYLGVGAVDYSDNVGSHLPGAYSALGTLRAFISGRISHYFGWTGPSITTDTACSSSAVAMHTACKALVGGECSMAVAGGVNVITSPGMWQNLAAASFLSPTGASKAFDAKADGYCRGEGAGLVVLKRLTDAMNAGDSILGVISGSAVNQNQNCTPITVPHSPSQNNLYLEVTRQAGIDPAKISYVEAHGTGTAVGDPIESQSIRDVFGGSLRDDVLHFGSVKSNIGHTEAASGAAAMIKSVLMLQHGSIPVQANFDTLNPAIPPLEPDKIAIARSTQSWDSNFKAICINNYGAAGSNAALIVCQPPLQSTQSLSSLAKSEATKKARYPLFVSARNRVALEKSCQALQTLVEKACFSQGNEKAVANLTFNLSRKQNRDHRSILATTVESLADLQSKIEDVATNGSRHIYETPQSTKPIVLVLGGQASSYVGMSKELYESTTLLQSHLLECESISRSLGVESFLPEIFSNEPVGDVVKLHCMLFSIQYSCAKSWIDSGLEVSAIIGHSFGQLSALAVSGVLSLEDALKLIHGRATLVKEKWGSDSGSMLAVEADATKINGIISGVASRRSSADTVEIVCYNGPTSFVLGGLEEDIEMAAEIAKEKSITFKKIPVTHAYHCKLVDNILPGLKRVADQVTFREAQIPLETCSDHESWKSVDPARILEHARGPVYFSQAVKRISDRLGSCIWLESGSGSAMGLVKRNLDKSSADVCLQFQGREKDGFGSLANVTTSLWQQGVKIQFWPFHKSQSQAYENVNLPPYPFDKTRHWIDYKDDPLESTRKVVEQVKDADEGPPQLVSFQCYEDKQQTIARFNISQKSNQYLQAVSGHAVLNNNLCPASFYCEMAARAASILAVQDEFSQGLVPGIKDLAIYAPLGIDLSRCISLVLEKEQEDKTYTAWKFTLSSSVEGKGGDVSKHASGKILLSQPTNKDIIQDFSRFGRLLRYREAKTITEDPRAEGMQGSVIYKSFAKVVNYKSYYRGVQSVTALDDQSTGRVVKPQNSQDSFGATKMEPIAIDNFLQVAGLHVNSLREIGPDNVYVCTAMQKLQLGPALLKGSSWVVYSSFETTGDRSLENDIFIFDSKSNELVMTILGVQFTRVSMNSLAKALSRVNSILATTQPIDELSRASRRSVLEVKWEKVEEQVIETETARVKATSTGPNVEKKLRTLLSDMLDIPSASITENSSPEDLGIDSLMTTEIANEIKNTLGCNLTANDLHAVDSFRSLLNLVSLSGDSIPQKIANGSGETSPSLGSTSSSLAASSATSVSGYEVEVNENETDKLAEILAENLDYENGFKSDTLLVEAGMDSLISTEVKSEIEQKFGVKIDSAQLDDDTTFGQLCEMVFGSKPSRSNLEQSQSRPESSSFMIDGAMSSQTSFAVPTPSFEVTTQIHSKMDLSFAADTFASIRDQYEDYIAMTKFKDFRKVVYPKQSELVVTYIAEGFKKLGCDLGTLQSGETLPTIKHLPKHKQVMQQYYRALEEFGLVEISAKVTRTSKPLPILPSSELLEAILEEFPQHRSEHRLLNITGSKLAECLTGETDPIHLLFKDKVSKELLTDVYTNAPMFASGTYFLSKYLVDIFEKYRGRDILKICELGAGTGGTARYIMNQLTKLGVPFEYTFTDLSPSLVTAAKRNFSTFGDKMAFRVIDIEKAPAAELCSRFDIVISTNCIHATSNLTTSTTNIHKLLKENGFLCLVELTRELFWFELVFGLVEGWWLFNDGRKHALADESRWQRNLKEAKFKRVDWTVGNSIEAEQLRVITAFSSTTPRKATKSLDTKETIEYHKVGNTRLHADIYYPDHEDAVGVTRPIALMIHGGGHIMLSRSDIRPPQTQKLLEDGFLPVSIDYRLCPEISILEGPMADACTALQWARETLPTLCLSRPDITPDGSRVAAVGWSTGGTLAMTLAFTAADRGIRPPDSILAFYCPTDYEDPFWQQPNIPAGSEDSAASAKYNLLEGLKPEPLTAYNVEPAKHALGGWMDTSDARSRIALHMNWHGQALPVIMGGLVGAHGSANPEAFHALPQPSAAEVKRISPRAQIAAGKYTTPTFIVHGTRDDLVPWEQAAATHEALKARGVPTGLSLVDGAIHLFDLYPSGRKGKGGDAIRQGYEFLKKHVWKLQ